MSPAGVAGLQETPRTYTQVVESVLLDLPFARDRAVSFAIERLARPHGPALVAAIARELGLSERQLERRFRAQVGRTPKRFASLARFERAVER